MAVDRASGYGRPVARGKARGYYFSEKRVPVDDMRLSPDGRWIAAQTSEQLYLLPRPADPAAVVDLTAPGNPARRVTDMGADFFDWRADGSLIWTVGNYLQTLPDTAAPVPTRSEEHTSDLQSLMRISYAV